MKIREVKWKDHPILGNLLLNFVNAASGVPYETIVLAGENGVGKSTILQTLSTFLNLGSFDPFDYIEYVVDGAIYRAMPRANPDLPSSFFRITFPDNSVQDVNSDRNNSPKLIQENRLDPRHYGCVFSKARADYKTKAIENTKTSTLDSEKYESDGEDDFTSLKQLVVDVVNQDNSDYAETNKTRGANPVSWDAYYATSKMYRFQNSFDQFFDGLAYERVSDLPGEKAILFKKDGISIPIDNLSTGEKQIVFRGIFLLRNSGILESATVMIDEPELSMHPKWQTKILQYYKGLFTKRGVQNAQLIFATHSDHVLNEALSDEQNTLVITVERVNGGIAYRKIDSPSVLPSITSAETNYLAFDLASHDYHIELYGWLQDKHNLRSIKTCDDYIAAQPHYDVTVHQKHSRHNTTTYQTLPTYVRNAIHHPDSGNTFTGDELRTSIKLLIKLL